MKKFELDHRLKNDCINVGTVNNIIVLLLDNSQVPWIILVPKTDKIELHELPQTLRDSLAKLQDKTARFIQAEFTPDKLNIAAIGNVVSQMHIHIIGRYKSDPCWPGVVWGNLLPKKYDNLSIIEKVKEALL